MVTSNMKGNVIGIGKGNGRGNGNSNGNVNGYGDVTVTLTSRHGNVTPRKVKV